MAMRWFGTDTSKPFNNRTRSAKEEAQDNRLGPLSILLLANQLRDWSSPGALVAATLPLVIAVAVFPSASSVTRTFRPTVKSATVFLLALDHHRSWASVVVTVTSAGVSVVAAPFRRTRRHRDRRPIHLRNRPLDRLRALRRIGRGHAQRHRRHHRQNHRQTLHFKTPSCRSRPEHFITAAAASHSDFDPTFIRPNAAPITMLHPAPHYFVPTRSKNARTSRSIPSCPTSKNHYAPPSPHSVVLPDPPPPPPAAPPSQTARSHPAPHAQSTPAPSPSQSSPPTQTDASTSPTPATSDSDTAPPPPCS